MAPITGWQLQPGCFHDERTDIIESLSYLHLYYAAAAIGMLSLPLFIARGFKGQHVGLRILAISMILAVYLVGMLRSNGVDIDNYRYAFEEDVTFIPDRGFQLVMQAFRAAGLPFTSLMAAIALVNVLAVSRLSRHFNVSFGLLLVLWFLHIAVVRDFAQLRSSLAVSLAIIGLTSRFGAVKWALYVASASIHLTSVVFALGYEACRHLAGVKSGRVRTVVLIAGLGLTLLLGTALPNLGFVDERIPLYLAWEKEGYGTPIDSFGALILHMLVLGAAWLSRSNWPDDARLRTVFYLELLGIAAFIAMSSVAIFAFRLSNILLSLYPVLLLVSARALHPRLGHRSLRVLAGGGLLFAFALVLLLRPGNADILALITLG